MVDVFDENLVYCDVCGESVPPHLSWDWQTETLCWKCWLERRDIDNDLGD